MGNRNNKEFKESKGKIIDKRTIQHSEPEKVTKKPKLGEEKTNLDERIIIEEQKVDVQELIKLEREKILEELKKNLVILEVEKFKKELENKNAPSMKEIIDEIFEISKIIDPSLTSEDLKDISERFKLLITQWTCQYEINDKEGKDFRIKVNSHISTTDPYNQAVLAQKYKTIKGDLSMKLFKSIIQKKKKLGIEKDSKILLKEFLELLFLKLDEFVNEYIQKIDIKNEKLIQDHFDVKKEEETKFQKWFEYGLIEFGKDKDKFYEKMLKEYTEIKGLLDEPFLKKALNELVLLRLMMRLATPESRFEFNEKGKEFNEDRHETFSESMKKSGIVNEVILPIYIVKDGLSDEDRVFQKAVVYTDINE